MKMGKWLVVIFCLAVVKCYGADNKARPFAGIDVFTISDGADK